MNNQPHSENKKSLGIVEQSSTTPVFNCLVYLKKADGKLSGHVANLDGFETTGVSERDVLSRLTQQFKTHVARLTSEGETIAWIDPIPAPSDGDQVRRIPIHL
jgi:predicted RNase H-like HicB family nuclease